MGVQGDLARKHDLVVVIVDVQERLAQAMERRTEVIDACSRLLRFAELVQAPVVITRQYPRGLGDTAPELLDVLEGLGDGLRLTTVDKTAFCACAEPEFMDALRAPSRTQIVLAGMESHICVLQTALVLADSGYSVHVAGDACCSRSDRDHSLALDRMRASGVVVTTSESVMYEAIGIAGTDEFRALLSIVKGS